MNHHPDFLYRMAQERLAAHRRDAALQREANAARPSLRSGLARFLSALALRLEPETGGEPRHALRG